MKSLTINIPDSLNLTPKEVQTALAAQLYEIGKLTLGQASELAGYSKREFMEVLSDYGVSVFNFDEDELDKDIENAKKHNIGH